MKWFGNVMKNYIKNYKKKYEKLSTHEWVWIFYDENCNKTWRLSGWTFKICELI